MNGLALAALAIVLTAAPAYAFTGANCTLTPTPARPARALISELKDWASIPGGGGDKFEGRACIYYGMGLLRAFTGDDRSAIDVYSRAIAIMRNFADAYEARGDAYAELGMKDEAEADYAKAAESSIDGPVELHIRCWARAIRGVPLDRALEDCNEALERSRTEQIHWAHTWDPYDTRCLVHLRMSNSAAAIADCSEALKHNQRLASSLYLRGLAKIQSGDRVGGNADIATAREADYRIAEKYEVFGVKLLRKN